MNTATESGLEIAVIGMNGRFPDAPTINDFWNNLKNGRESVTFFSDDELRKFGISEEYIQHPDYVKAKPYLKNIEYFDSVFFGYTPNEASVLDIQMRMFHEIVYHALEDAGYDAETYNGLIGLYAGSSTDIHWLTYLLSREHQSILDSFETGILAYKDLLSQLISYKLNLKGPSHTLYTSCSTSLSAIHLACRALLLGECNIAVAGGITINLPKKVGYFYEEGMIHSKDGHCRAFDNNANGTIFGDGAGAVVLKRLQDAKEDKDHIYAVIKGSFSNNDGNRKVGFTAPSVEGQAEVISSAYSFAQVDPNSITYVEAHATGTNIGDPIELEALRRVFNSNNKEVCALGSVKANIGHLHAASGIASFIKTVLSVYHKCILPQINCSVVNSKMNLKSSPFYINTEFKKWEKLNGYPLRAGISSFGIGGMNVHVIAEEYQSELEEIDTSGEAKYHLLTFSAKTEKALDRLINDYVDFLDDNHNIDLSRVAYTLQVGRRKMRYKKAFVIKTSEDFIKAVKEKNNNSYFESNASSLDKTVSFVIAGQHNISFNKVVNLYNHTSIFRHNVDECLHLLPKEYSDKAKSYLFTSKENSNTKDPFEVIAIFIVEFSLTRLWNGIGISPKDLIGFGIGEYVAATISGVFELKDTLGLLISYVKTVDKYFKNKGYNSDLNDCNQMQQISESILEFLNNITLKSGTIPIFSLATNSYLTDDILANKKYWASSIFQYVEMEDTYKLLSKQKAVVYIDISPSQGLYNYYEQRDDNSAVFQLLNGMPNASTNDYDRYLYTILAQCYIIGVSIDWEIVHQEKKYKRISLPLYPFEKNKIWDEEINTIRSLQTGFGSSRDNADKKEHNYVQGKNISKSIQYKERPVLSSDYKMPESVTEHILIEMLEDLFGIKPIGVEDDFFELGGHSLLITQAASRVKDIFQIDISLDMVFETPNIRSIVGHLEEEWGSMNTVEEIAKAYNEYQQI